MKKILREAEKVDRKENKKYGKERGYDQLPPRLADPKTGKKEIKRLMDKMNKLKMADEKIKSKQKLTRIFRTGGNRLRSGARGTAI